MNFEYKIEGIEELLESLSYLPIRVRNRVLKPAVRKGARVLIKEIRSRVPKKSRNLQKSINLKFQRRDRHNVTAYVGPTVGKTAKYDGWYAHLVEYGTDPHYVSGKKKGSLKASERIPHPGGRKKPFMRPAFDEKADEIVSVIGEAILDGVEKEAKKL